LKALSLLDINATSHISLEMRWQSLINANSYDYTFQGVDGRVEIYLQLNLDTKLYLW